LSKLDVFHFLVSKKLFHTNGPTKEDYDSTFRGLRCSILLRHAKILGSQLAPVNSGTSESHGFCANNSRVRQPLNFRGAHASGFEAWGISIFCFASSFDFKPQRSFT